MKSISLCCFLLAAGLLNPVLGEGDGPKTDIGDKARLVTRERSLQKLRSRFDLKTDESAILISICEQELHVAKGDSIVRVYTVSTSQFGVGNEAGSNKTPLGTHRIVEKIGQGAPLGAIFQARRDTGKIARISTDSTNTPEDLILTRILRLEGLEPGINRGRGVDSFGRCIYIHGTSEEGLIGTPASHGCIRMKNGDVMELFDLVQEGTLVEIHD